VILSAISLGVPPDQVERLVRQAEHQGLMHGLSFGVVIGAAIVLLLFGLFRK